MTSYLDITTNALIESISVQAKLFAGPTIKIQVLKLCSNKQLITEFIDKALKYYQKKYPNKPEELICLGLLCDLEYNFEDNPITEDEDYIPSPLYKYLMQQDFRNSNFVPKLYDYYSSSNLKYNNILTSRSQSFLTLLETCERKAIDRLHSKDIEKAKLGASEIEKLALIRQEHVENNHGFISKVMKKLGLTPNNSLDIINEKRYKMIIESK